MINVQDQEELFKLLADYLEENVDCVAIGGTAMMMYGYKTTTKDIDLVFRNEKDRSIFVRAIEKLGYSQKTLKFVYDEKRINNKSKPTMYSREDERFDLFVTDVFGIKVDFDNAIQKHEYVGKKEFVLNIISKEDLVLLKSVTNRERDYEDMELIVKMEPNLDWNVIIDGAIGNNWALIDLEEKMQKLKKLVFIKKEYFDRIYSAVKK